jgi:hypothetical protein
MGSFGNTSENVETMFGSTVVHLKSKERGQSVKRYAYGALGSIAFSPKSSSQMASHIVE